MLTAADLCSTPDLLSDAGSFRLIGGGHTWVDAERKGRLVRITRIAQTQAGPKVRQEFVNPHQAVTLVRAPAPASR